MQFGGEDGEERGRMGSAVEMGEMRMGKGRRRIS